MLTHNKKNTKHQGIKRYLFYAILITLPFFFFIVVEGGLHLFGYGENLALFVPAPKKYPNHLICNPQIGKRYFFMQETVTHTPNDYFLKQKPSDSYRIFVMGASTTAGFPYGDGLMFSRILQRRLQDTFPERTIEVINTAMTAVNSYTLLDILDEIIEMKPDAVLLYAGHNEFYGALGVASLESLGKNPWFVHLYLKLQRYKTFILLRNSIAALRKKVSGSGETDITATLMERIVEREDIPYDSKLYKQGIAQYKSNLYDIIEKLKNAGIPLLISELVSNLRDQPPLHAANASISAEARRLYHQARLAENKSNYSEAKQNYRKAKDMDPIRFRAPQAFNIIINELAQKNNIPVVPMQKYFEDKSPHGLIGENLMIDHLHPNIDGYFLMAEAFYQTMRKERFISGSWPQAYIKPGADYRADWSITAVDSIYIDLIIRYLKAGWPFKPKTDINTVLKDFNAHTLADTLAEKVIYDELNLAKAHIQMAEYYQSKNDFAKAEREFKALFQILNEDDLRYINRVDILIAHREFEKALGLLYKIIEIHETSFALKRIGQIHLDIGRTKDALPFLERAYKITSDDSHLLYLLCKSYAVTGQRKSAIDALNNLKAIDPNYNGMPFLENLISKAEK
jgi:lysophospholipase L1-like esterase